MEKFYLKCDVCEKKAEYQDGVHSKIYHYTGTINFKWSNHLHVCEDCRNLHNLQENEIMINTKGDE